MKWVVLAVIMVTLAGFFHIMFIMYDNLWYDNESGVMPKLSGILNESMTSDTQNRTWNWTVVFHDAFGLGRVICIGLTIGFAVLEAFDKPRIQG